MTGAAMAGDGVIRNETLWRDDRGEEIWCNGGHMIRHGERFYWIGYETSRQRPWKINLYSSTNLADWTFERTLIRREGDFASFGWAGRPTLLHHRASGKFVIVFEASSRGWPQHKIGFAVSDRIDGDYTLVNVQPAEEGRASGDQSVYQEGDDAYLLCNLDYTFNGQRYRNCSMAIFKLTDDFLGVERKLFEGFSNVTDHSGRNMMPRHNTAREAPDILKVNGVYYWFTSGLDGWKSSATMYATARDLSGPWSELKLLRTDPPSPDSYNTQHDFVIPIVGSETTTYLYVGDRYSQHHGRGPGRNIFVPMLFDGEEPRLQWMQNWRIDVATGHFSEVPADGGPSASADQ